MSYKNLIVILLFALCSFAQAQDRERKPYSVNNVTLSNEDNLMLHKFSFPDSELIWSKLFITNKKFNIIYCKKDSSDFISFMQSDFFHRRWTKSNNEISYNNKKRYASELFPTIYGSNTYPVYLFYGDEVIYYSYLENNRSSWISDRKLSVTLGKNNSIIGVVSGINGNAYVLFNSEDSTGTNLILKIRTLDNGYNWSGSGVAVKHNTQELKGWCVASRKEDPKTIYMLLNDNNNTPYYSQTTDGGNTWSYPKRISIRLAGDSYKMTINNGYVMITFRRVNDDGTFDMMMWHGSLSEFTSEQKKGNLAKVADKLPDMKESNFSVEDTAYYKNRRYYMLIKSVTNGTTTLQVHLIRRMNY
ncbi:MAG: hypothetical protein RR550_01050 [Rikenellaceae bacterium]